VGHKHGTRDKEDLEFWTELRIFFETGNYPTRLTTDKDRFRFLKRSRRFFLHNDRLWLAPKLKSGVSPRLTIEVTEKRQELIAQAHNDCGHRGRDAVY
ncbi:hypothetical protein IW262DRAFT_1257314, partial [Armillaria fumosa]